MLGFLFWCGVAIILLMNGWIVSGSILVLLLIFTLIGAMINAVNPDPWDR